MKIRVESWNYSRLEWLIYLVIYFLFVWLNKKIWCRVKYIGICQGNFTLALALWPDCPKWTFIVYFTKKYPLKFLRQQLCSLLFLHSNNDIELRAASGYIAMKLIFIINYRYNFSGNFYFKKNKKSEIVQ